MAYYNNELLIESENKITALTETNRLLNLECEELKGDIKMLRESLEIMVDFAEAQMHPMQYDPSMFDDEDFGNLNHAKRLLDK